MQGIDSNRVHHGYLRTTGGKFTEFDPTGSVSTLVTGINTKNSIVREYFDPAGGLHSFVRLADGTITPINSPNAAATAISNISQWEADPPPWRWSPISDCHTSGSRTPTQGTPVPRLY